jgi:AAA family ATP:ADP antiporter
MTRLLRRLFDLREGEGFKASLMFGFGMLSIATVVILKSVSNSLFVDSQGAGKLPYVFMLVAIFSALIAFLYGRFSKKARLNRLIILTFLASIASLFLFWLLFRFQEQSNWLFYAFYTWVVIFSVIAGSQFWLLANDIYNAREAKRIFGFIGAGAIIGGISGGIGGAAADNPLRLILDSRHLTYLAGIICIGVLVANLADYQYRILAEQTFADGDALTAFFGLMQSLVNIFALAIQLLLTSRVMKILGVTASLFFLPIGLLAGAMGILISPALWSAVLIKLSDGSLKHSMYRAGLELLYLPIPPETKKRAKTFIDVFLKNFAKGAAGLGLIGLTVWMGLTLQHISLVLIALIGLWCYLIIRVKKEYVDSFRQAIEKRTINLDEQPLNLEDASLLKGFIKVLEGENERKMLYILGLLENVRNKELIPHMERLITHPSPEIRALVLGMSLQYPEIDLSTQARELVPEDDIDLQCAAISYLFHSSQDAITTIKEFLGHDDERIQAAAIDCAAREWKENKDFRKQIDLKEKMASLLNSAQGQIKDAEQRKLVKIQTARAIGHTQDKELSRLLLTLLQDDEPEVVKAAVDSVGLALDPDFLPALFDHLNTKHIRKNVRECLAAYGEDVIDILAELMSDERQDRRKRLAVPQVLALIGSHRSVDLLWQSIEQGDLSFRYQCIRALNKLRVGFPDLKFDPNLIKARIFDEIELYSHMLQSWMQQNILLRQERPGSEQDNGNPYKSRRLLALAMEERLEDSLERIFRLLGLRYPPKDMFNAYLGLMSDSSRHRASAIEFLDNVLESDLKTSLVHIVENARPQLLKNMKQPLDSQLPGEEASIELVLRGDDKWLSACAIFLIAMFGLRQFMDSVRPLIDAQHPLIRETARLCIRRLDHS